SLISSRIWFVSISALLVKRLKVGIESVWVHSQSWRLTSKWRTRQMQCQDFANKFVGIFPTRRKMTVISER
ncbi:hypothetical protein, partial [Nitrosomonas nitrosa]|uniref:hypothetical protein n=1 Tax=Nitrosomonas nitrosa TaxID=52442 RepID=UPI001C431A8E